MEKTIFEKIIDREIPASIVYEDEKCICIIDRFPTTKGQVLVISKKVVDNLFDLSNEEYSHIMKISKKIEGALRKTFSPERNCMVIEGFEVPHAHIKLYPVYDQILKISNGTEISTEQMEEYKNKIISNL